MIWVRWISLIPFVALFVAGVMPAKAADVVFPTGSLIGIAPPPGLEATRRFMGFEDASNRVAITMVALPRDAYAELEKTTGPLQQQGVTIEQREDFSVAAGKAILMIARQKLEKITLHKWILAASAPEFTAIVTFEVPDDARRSYPDGAIRAALASVSAFA